VVLGVGGGGPDPVRAAALDPATGSWRSLADAPLTGLDLGEAAVSTGDRLVTATGIYDPTTDGWEMATGCHGFTTTTAVWTGQVVLTPTIALDPYNGRCLPLPAPSKGLRTVAIREFPWFAWTGRSLVLWSGVIGDQVSPPNDGASVTPDIR
jgi:hypothetical protein